MRISLFLMFFALAACGQKGQLYLPEAAPPAETPSVSELPEVPAEQDKKDDNGEALH